MQHNEYNASEYHQSPRFLYQRNPRISVEDGIELRMDQLDCLGMTFGFFTAAMQYSKFYLVLTFSFFSGVELQTLR